MYKLKYGTHSLIKNGKRVTYEAGDELEPREKDLKKWPDRFKKIEETESKKAEEDNNEIDYTKIVKQYHKGGGYYDIPEVKETIKGKADAIEALKEVM